MSEWDRIDAWMREDSPWLFLPREEPPQKVRKGLRRLAMDRDRPEYLEAAHRALQAVAIESPYGRSLARALTRCPSLTPRQAALAVRLVEPHASKLPTSLRAKLGL